MRSSRTPGAAVAARNTVAGLLLSLSLLGLSEVGIASATLSHRLNSTELAEICDDARAKVLFAHESCRATVDAARFATVREVIWFGADFEARLAAATPLTPERSAGRGRMG